MTITSRRRLLHGGLAASALLLLPAAGRAELPLTPACDADGPATPRQTEGPFYTRDTPEKADFRADAEGEPLLLAGFVLDRRCRPVAQALVDLWHADAAGRYDNAGFRLRGHQITDAEGRFAFATIVPGAYPGRTLHYHVKVQAPGGPLLTTQLYFPDHPGNARDRLFDPALLMTLEQAGQERLGRFDFVVETA